MFYGVHIDEIGEQTSYRILQTFVGIGNQHFKVEIRKEVEEEQIGRLKSLKENRNNRTVRESLDAISEAATKGANLMPLIIDAAKSYTTMGEIVDAMKIVFGEWEENTVL